ncbi:MAG: DNA repair ATPase, partial [Polyangiaceae bacterium]|nr:DNA repair ATPase [Polyangiaceae bacterium]
MTQATAPTGDKKPAPAAADKAAADAKAGGAAADLEGGSYEVIRNRLLERGRELFARTERLNERRKQVFGGSELSVIANERVRTENNCVPRDIIQVSGRLLVGYEVFLGLKSETKVSDVFALHRFDAKKPGEGGAAGDGAFDMSALPPDAVPGLLDDENFKKDFEKLFRYFRDARLLQLNERETQKLAIFQAGQSHLDIKVFRWRVEPGGHVVYQDDRGERDYVFPKQHDFEWKTCTREQQVAGKHPHFNVENLVFVEAVGGDLTIKVENNTDHGEGIYSEPVEDKNQVLDDGTYQYAVVGGLVILRVRPFREEKWRHLVFNVRTKTVVRIDAIEQACVELPEDHGLIFPGGYYLATGDYKLFEGDREGLELQRTVRSPNGEDVLYVFHRRKDGYYVLLPYNMIRKEVATPIACQGYSLFDDGRLIVFRSTGTDPVKLHPMQVWKTPFTSADFAAQAPTDGSYLAKIGNAELVRGVSEAFSLCRLAQHPEPARQTFEDLIAGCSRLIDSYFWVGHAEAFDLKTVAANVRDTAELIVDEFEKVLTFKSAAKKAIAETQHKLEGIVKEIRPAHWKRIEPFLDALTALRSLRGAVITLRETRYIDRPRLDELEKSAVGHFDALSKDCVAFLLRDEALAPLATELEQTHGKLGAVGKVADILPLRDRLDATSKGLDLLSEVVQNLKIDDATARTRILESMSEVYAKLNRVRASVEGRRRELLVKEGKAEFAAQFKLLGQSVSSALNLCDTPERCDEQLSRLLVQLEELEGRFSEFDEFLGDLTQKREEIYDAFGSKKQALLDERNRRIGNLAQAGERILEGVGRRARSFGTEDELNAYFASDAMILKVQDIAAQLQALGDSVKSDGLGARLKAARQDALRSLRDKLDLYEGGGELIKLGKHRFSVNTQQVELTVVPREGGMALHLAGTDFYEPIDDAAFAATKEYWDQTLVSETPEVYRGEYLASSMLADAEAGRNGLSLALLHDAARAAGAPHAGLLERVRAYAADRYDEGYERGIHDSDAVAILEKLLLLRESAGLLRFAPAARALGQLYYASEPDPAERHRLHRQAKNLGRLRQALGHNGALVALGDELGKKIGAFFAAHGLAFAATDVRLAGLYLAEELTAQTPRFATSAEALKLEEALLSHVDKQGSRQALEDDLAMGHVEHASQQKPALGAAVGTTAEPHLGLAERFRLAQAWVEAFLAANDAWRSKSYLAPEVAVLLCGGGLDRTPSAALTEAKVEGLLGQHPRIVSGALVLRIDELLPRLAAFQAERVPGYRAYRKLRHELIEQQKRRLRLDEFKPRVMSAFVRNRLVNEVYLPLVGDNLAKQLGAAGDAKRTDLMGLLLLVSPPGYGKTTLMEYVASRLGLVFVKVNGPALGHGVLSLDPSEAPNATARQEVEKINLALEMGNNVMLYLDDIQHTNAELLQKFISLCDAQRRIEGVWKGRTRTYDMRGRKFCVVMAGNPYTESGEKFKIPDMLANRADTYNLGDILEGKEEQFALSYLENALTSNAALAPLATRDMKDVYKIIRMAQGEEIPTTELTHGYAAVELGDIQAVFRHLFRVQQTLLKVNLQYIASASQDDRFRTEPPFKLQGSYRNMNKLAEKVVPAMNDAEVERLVDDHYQSESQTLTIGAEQNLLKLAELRGRQNEEQEKRWKQIKDEFVRLRRMGGAVDDPVTRLTGTLTGLAVELDGIKSVLASGSSAKQAEHFDTIARGLEGIRAAVHRAAAAQPAAAAGAAAGASAGVSAADGALLTRALRALADNAEGQKPGKGDKADKGEKVDKTDKALALALSKLGSALEQVSKPELQVTVQPPPGLEAMLKYQVELVERTLVPVVRAATAHLGDSQALRQLLLQVLDELKQLDRNVRLSA